MRGMDRPAEACAEGRPEESIAGQVIKVSLVWKQIFVVDLQWLVLIFRIGRCGKSEKALHESGRGG